MAARVPDDLHRGAVRGDAPGVGVGLAEPEERVLRALDEQRRRLDPVEHARGAAPVEHRGDLRRERARGRGGLIGRADVGPEPPAGQRLLHHGRVEGAGVEAGQPVAVLGTVAGVAVLRPAQGVEQATAGGRRSDAEEQSRPQPLVDAGIGVLRRRRHRLRAVGAAGLGREERRGQRVPGDLRRDGVDAVVVGRAQQGQRPAVGASGDPDPRVAVAVELDLVTLGQQVDQRRQVGDLVAGVVQPDLPGALAEAARRVGQDDVAALGQIAGVVGHRVLAATEAVGEDHRRRGFLPRREVEGRVQLDGVGTGAGRNAGLLGGDVLGGRRRAGPARADRPRAAAEAGQRTSRGRRSAGGDVRARERGARSGQRTAAGSCSTPDGLDQARPSVTSAEAGDQGCQSPAATTTRPGVVTSGGSSKNRSAGPCSCGN